MSALKFFLSHVKHCKKDAFTFISPFQSSSSYALYQDHFNKARISKLPFYEKGLSILVLPLFAAFCSSVLTGKISIGIRYFKFRFIDLLFQTRAIFLLKLCCYLCLQSFSKSNRRMPVSNDRSLSLKLSLIILL